MDGVLRWSRQNVQPRFVTKDRRSLAIVLALFLTVQFGLAVARSPESLKSRMEAAASIYCNFSTSEKIYNLTDFLQCMDELAASVVAHSRISRSSENRDSFPPNGGRVRPYQSSKFRYPQRPIREYQSYYDGRPVKLYPGEIDQAGQSGHYDGGPNFPSQQPFSFSGGPGLFDALASITQYDDLKCVPRILCELATGVIPGNSGYKQNYDGGNSLVGLLTALDIGESSPLLTFGKSALTGYANRGNPGVCFRQYPRCPRSNAALVDYLNNHNGGFFRFFGNTRGPSSRGNYHRGATRREPAPPPGLSGPEADRTGTGELKFDSAGALLGRGSAESFFPEGRGFKSSSKVTFPQERLQEEESQNSVAKSLVGYQDSFEGYPNPSFFPEDRKDPESNMVYASPPLAQSQSMQLTPRITEASKGRLYLPEDPANETQSTFTFPDGQKVRINVAFSKLFSESYTKARRRSFANDHGPQPIDFEGFSMVSLAELFPNDRSTPDLQAVHPCDMVCHDSNGTSVQFNQILLHSGSLNTLMTPDQPVLDLSSPLPCEVLCINRRGERRQLSTTLDQVLRTSTDRPLDFDAIGYQERILSDSWRNRDYRSQKRLQQPRESQDRNDRGSIELPQQNIQERPTDHELLPMTVEDTGMDYHLGTHAPEARDLGPSDNRANDMSVGKIAAAISRESRLFHGAQMPFVGPAMPFMGMPSNGPVQAPPNFYPGGPLGPARMAMPPMPFPMQPNIGMTQSLGMMPMFPRFPPFFRPFPGLPPILPARPLPMIVCSQSGCAGISQSPQRILMMCGRVLYFIPKDILMSSPVCALHLGSEKSKDPHSVEPQSTSTPPSTFPPDRGTQPDVFESVQPPTTHTFRQPGASSIANSDDNEIIYFFERKEGEDYPQQSCLEDESWNLDMHECVPMKYDPDYEQDYTPLSVTSRSGVSRKSAKSHKLKKSKKLVIITGKGNITYIKVA